MKPRILLVAQCWNGCGGLQRYSRDLWHMLKTDDSIVAKKCTPFSRGIKAQLETLIKGLIRVLLFRYDVVVCTSADLVPIAWFVSRFCRARGCLCAVGLDLLLRRRWYQGMLHRLLPGVDCVVGISRATSSVAIGKGARVESVVTIPVGTFIPKSIRKVSRSTSSPLLLSVGRLIHRKGHAWFIRSVMPLLVKELSGLKYRLIGSGRERDAVIATIQEHGLEHYVEFLEGASDLERDSSYVEADVFIMPNIPIKENMEGQGLVCIEASARGLPVVAARLEGIEDAVIAGKTGMFFPPGDVLACVGTILGLLENPLNPEDVHRATAKAFSWDRLYLRYKNEAFLK